MTTLSTKLAIGFKFQVQGNNFTKLVCNKSRYIDVTLVNDLFNVKAYTLRGVNELKISELKGVYVENLQEAILKVY
jgi:hypothetical protein